MRGRSRLRVIILLSRSGSTLHVDIPAFLLIVCAIDFSCQLVTVLGVVFWINFLGGSDGKQE
jgi:hypothetical protein